ncbi:gamma carbonic anhydrase family protein [Sphingosinicella rhizophila]|uniref:Gamma carbonic anhydrase family protein n=1 Tax=Sphingosinicella rhizophila TaxID=3050082 RepID=A0ABU3Q3B1_9SPHN|nr:gamma carbonic anhydrase family protein [Sphingosinicella sp. GR2756]MDT9597901.1 gamma carbonic anhydrase family protein [Sphingosinicella sp. GR2756]
MTIFSFGGQSPRIDPTAFIAPGARLIGNIEVGPEASIWYNCVIRGDVNSIRIGARSNVQDGSVVHCESVRPGSDSGHATIIGDDVLIGHLAVVHGCVLRDGALVGMGAIVMNGCEMEENAMLAAGAMLTPGRRIPAGQLWAGRPAKFVRDLGESELADMRYGVSHYVALAKAHREMISQAQATT